MLQTPEWPAWAVQTFLGLALFTTAFAGVQKIFFSGAEDKRAKESNPIVGDKVPQFRAFQRQYLVVYFLVMMADWLQGTHMYTLYSGYGVNAGALFMTGFSSSLLFGTVVGLFVDRWGRRFSCIVYLLLEVAVNICEHFNNFPLLVLSRIAGGVSSSLLFSAFESWIVSEHRAMGFPEEWLADTFSWGSFGNGLSAIAAGILAQVCADARGEIGPFQAAIFFTVVALPLVCCWRENHGDGHGAAGGELAEGEDRMTMNLGAQGMAVILRDRRVLLVGLATSFFEGSMYSFVFMWVPTLLGVVEGQHLPTGLVFSSLMCSMSLGGLLFASLNSLVGVEYGTLLVFIIGALALTLPVFFTSLPLVLGSFIVFETCVGAFFPCAAYLRSKVIPNEMQGSIMNIFRVPLNLLVVVGTKLTDHYSPSTCFSVIIAWLLVGALLQLLLASSLQQVPFEKPRVEMYVKEKKKTQ